MAENLQVCIPKQALLQNYVLDRLEGSRSAHFIKPMTFKPEELWDYSRALAEVGM